MDRVLMDNTGDPGWSVADHSIELAGSAGRLVFDTVLGGAGINVAQPLRIVTPPAPDAPALAAEPRLGDGDERLDLAFARFAPGQRFTVSVDLDDRVSGAGGTRVQGAEIQGALLRVRFVHTRGGEEIHEGRFEQDARARAAAPCLS